MADDRDLSDIVSMWQVLPSQPVWVANENKQFLAADSRRWAVLFWAPNPAPGTLTIRPFFSNAPVSWQSGEFLGTPLLLTQTDYGPLVSGPWYGSVGFGGFTLGVLELIWIG